MRLQDGSEGCRVAQEREVIRGWAPEAKGEMAERESGMASSFVGKSVGDIKGLLRVSIVSGERGEERTYGQCKRAICARLSTMSYVPGHLSVAGKSAGLA